MNVRRAVAATGTTVAATPGTGDTDLVAAGPFVRVAGDRVAWQTGSADGNPSLIMLP